MSYKDGVSFIHPNITRNELVFAAGVRQSASDYDLMVPDPGQSPLQLWQPPCL